MSGGASRAPRRDLRPVTGQPTSELWKVSPVRQLQALLRQHLGAFTERCFYELSPTQAYLHNWHLEALAFHLEEVMAGRCQRLLITLPPRSLKSLFASVAFPAFVLGHDPTRKLICVCYAG